MSRATGTCMNCGQEPWPNCAPEREPLKGELSDDLKVAASHVAMLQKHPEYENVYGSGVLTVRLPGNHFEHYRYAPDLNLACEVCPLAQPGGSPEGA